MTGLRRSWTGLLVLAAALVVATAGLRAVWRLPGASDPAAAVHGSPDHDRRRDRDGLLELVAEGQLAAYPDAMVTLSAQVAGRLLFLAHESTRCARGDLIAEIDVSEEEAQLAEARARLEEADAQVSLQAKRLERIRRLRAAHITTEESLDEASENRIAAVAGRNRFAAMVARLEARVAKARVLAPISGTVVHRYEDVGNSVKAADRLLTIADLTQTRIVAEVDEFDAGRVAVGTKVRVTADGYRDASWAGIVEDVPLAVVDRALRPQDPGRPNDARVLLLKIALLEPTPLKLNQRVEVALPVVAQDGAARAGPPP